jgi:acyl-CoA thioesterase-1
VNAGVSGDTSAGGLRRLDWLLEQEPDVLVVELGGNDGLRGQPIPLLRDNLTRMVGLARQSGARVALAAIQIPPNYGRTYTRSLAALYPELAESLGVALVDLALETVALQPELMQGDRIHPNAEGQKLVFANVWRVLGPLLAARDAG